MKCNTNKLYTIYCEKNQTLYFAHDTHMARRGGIRFVERDGGAASPFMRVPVLLALCARCPRRRRA